MFEIGFPELVLIAIVGLLVIGPERLPEALRTLGLWLGRMRRSFTTVKAEIEKEIGMDEVKRQLHNEAILEEMKRIESEVKGTVDSARDSLNQGVQAVEAASAPAGEPPEVEPERSGADVDDRDHSDAGSDEKARAEAAAPGGAPPADKQVPAPASAPQADAMDYAIGNVATPPDDAEKASDRANNG